MRLIARARRGDDGSGALAVEPMLIPRENQLAGVEDVFKDVYKRQRPAVQGGKSAGKCS